jgi:hypothetical protein
MWWGRGEMMGVGWVEMMGWVGWVEIISSNGNYNLVVILTKLRKS